MHGTENVSPWIARWAHLVPTGASVLDIACGRGRHARFFAQRGCHVTAVDRDAAALESVQDVVDVDVVCADIENGPWPFAGRGFDAVVVTNYLWRPLLPAIIECVGPRGVLLYETFADGNAKFGKPSRPDFLLHPGELLETCRGLHVVAYEHGLLRGPDRAVQRIAAVRDSPVRHSLESPIPGENIS